MGAFASEHRVVCPDGGVRVIHSIGGITPGAGGQGLRIFGTMQDITERKQAEARLHELLARVEQWAAEMDATISSIADGVIVLSPDGAIVRMNAAAGDIFGVAHGAVPATYGELLAQLGVETPEGEAIRLENATTPHALLGETTLGLVRRFTRADGQHRWTSTSAAPIRMADGAITGAVLTFSDITILRELQQRQEELVHLVSHDLRIPLTVIHGHAELLEDALAEVHVDGDTALSLRAIDRAVQRMDVMIQDLVNMARLEGQRADLALEPVALAPFLRDMLGRMTGILDVGRMALDVPDDLPPVLADYTRLERIILNLLTNALKYSAPDTPVLIRARADDDHLTIMVIDQGEGIPPEELPHLFDRFYRAKGGRVAEGLGLGLYITRMLVEAMHGHIAVTSAPGQGSTFAVTLPCK
jgi:signal transduction histidine kinase